MTAVVQPQPTAPTARAGLDTTTQILIADLSPSHRESAAHILAQVALVWPYSSSTGTLALLLADPDIRRRKSNGQVKVIFRNWCAKEIAKTKVGIGDTIKLALAGCEWQETGDVVSTPGKKINWDLEYNTRVLLQVLRDQETATVDFTKNEADSQTANGGFSYLNRVGERRPMLNSGIQHQSSTIHIPYLTPRKSAGNHTTGTFIDAALESSAEDDGYILGRGRKRTKFARNSSAWSLVDSEEDGYPKEDNKADVDNEDAAQDRNSQAKEVALASEPAALVEDDQPEHQTDADALRESLLQFSMVRATEQDMVDISSSIPPAESIPSLPVTRPLVMGPPQTPHRTPPRLQPAINGMDDFDASDSSEAATTPRLLPVPSPGLPLVSPLVHRSGVEIGYFPPLDVNISQLDASTESQTRAVIPETKTEEFIDQQSPHSDESLVVAEEISTTQKLAEDVDATVAAHADTVQMPPESEMEVEDQETQQKVEYEAPQWLSSLESSIDRELLRSQDHPVTPTVSQPISQAIEVEDDDLYGAPVDITKANGLSMTSSAVERPRSPLDVLEQFLQMSPVSAAGSSMPLDSNGWKNALNSPLQQNAPESVAGETRQESAAVSAVENRSPGTYPESQSPFRQNRNHQASPVMSTRPSSRSSRPRSLDGTVDEGESFREYINHLSQVSTSAESSKQLAADFESSQRNISSETQVETAISAATVKVDTEAHIEFTEHIMVEVKQVTAVVTTGVKEADQSFPAATMGEEMKSGSNLQQHVHAQEPHAQLPTPDQSQAQCLSPEFETPKPVQELTNIAFLSPRYTQEESVGDSQEPIVPMQEEATRLTWEDIETVEIDAQGRAMPIPQVERADATQEERSQETEKEPAADKRPLAEPTKAGTSSPIAKRISTLQPDTITPRRSSQRLSARKSTMAASISSPYFTPRKSTRQLSSSPSWKENIRPATDDGGLLSSPTRGKAEAPLRSTAGQEVEQNSIDITPISPNLGVNGSASSNGIGTTTPFTYFTHLRSLHEHFGRLVDVLAVCTDSSSEPEQSKTGRKDYHTILELADPSLTYETHSAISAQVFRPVQTALPTTHRGDVVILRNFKVQTFRRRFMLVSTDTSSWAVFKIKAGAVMRWSDVVISGPPLEYGPAETSRVRLLFSWWNTRGKGSFNVDPARPAEHSEVESGSSDLRRSSPGLNEIPEPSRKVTPANRRRDANTSTDSSNKDQILEHLGSPTDRAEAGNNDGIVNRRHRTAAFPHPADTTDGIDHDNESTDVSVQRSNRRKANETDNFGNEGDEDVAMVGDVWEQSIPASDKTHRRRGSTISTAPSEAGRSFTPRRSARRRKSPSIVHELRDGTKYVDGDRRRSGSVVHELRDGVTYVDE